MITSKLAVSIIALRRVKSRGNEIPLNPPLRKGEGRVANPLQVVGVVPEFGEVGLVGCGQGTAVGAMEHEAGALPDPIS